ncbi:MAG TPA: ABC transporter permease [Polyangiales bacterium]
MSAWTLLSVAFSALLRNKVRSTLTTLGIVIGVAAVVMMQAMGGGATAYIGEAISGLGSNMLIVIPGSVRGLQHSELGAPLFTADDLSALRRQAHDVGMISAAGNVIRRLVNGPYHRSTVVAGVQPVYFHIRGWPAGEGRLPNEEDERKGRNVCAIGRTVAESLYPGSSPLGRELRIQQMSCLVVGVMSSKGASFGQDQDDVVFMPYSTFAHKIVGNDRIAALLLSAKSPDVVDDVKRQVSAILRRRRHLQANDEDDFAVRDPREMQSVLESVTRMLTALLAGVAAVSLVVGGIGIMNIMLVSVSERTREIGVRLAIGARPSHIMLQFLLEATALSVLGGVLGIGFGLAGAWLSAHALSVPFVVPAAAIALAFVVSLSVGVTFGVMPARKAAKLNPISALRYE